VSESGLVHSPDGGRVGRFTSVTWKTRLFGFVSDQLRVGGRSLALHQPVAVAAKLAGDPAVPDVIPHLANLSETELLPARLSTRLSFCALGHLTICPAPLAGL
jgi:hypothetical protein